MALLKTVFQKQDGLPVSRKMRLQIYLQAGSPENRCWVLTALKAFTGGDQGKVINTVTLFYSKKTIVC